jgi:hypothetical protein
MRLSVPGAVVLVSTVLMAIPTCATAAPARSLRLGFLDGGFADATVQTARLAEAKALGSTIVRLPSGWSAIAPRRPAHPADPADAAYAWSTTDQMVRAATAAGLDPLLSLTGAPRWAEGAHRPSTAALGSWRPNPIAYGQFARALARRYSGRYPDPLSPGTTLPRVREFVVWNEPNLDKYLAPQWRRANGRYRLDAAIRYRELTRRFWQGIHTVQPRAVVVAGALAPFGDPQPGGGRVAPAAFLRAVLCLTPKLRRTSCGKAGKPRFDVLAHHPYSVNGPFADALNPDDVSVPDIGRKLIKPLRSAERLGLLGSKRRRRVWVTEISWDSSPPDPDGVPSATYARWVAEAFYVLARQGIDTVTWFQVRDSPPGPGGYSASNQSGMLLVDGRPKRSATAFRFPLVAVRQARRTIVWAVAPASGTLVIERKAASGWIPLLTRPARHGAIVSERAALAVGTRVRARQGTALSLTVRVARS